MPVARRAARTTIARTTIKDVARAAGVSPSTVSFVLNDTPGQTIRESTRERVRTAARQLGYAPHGIARALREGTSRVVLLDVGTLPDGPGLESFVEGMADELAGLGHALLVARRQDRAALAEAVDAIAPRAVVDVQRPFAADDPAHPDGGWVHGLASHTITQLRHLVGRGHRRLAFAVPAGRAQALVATRLDHARQAAARLGIPAPATLVVPDGRDAVLAGLTEVLGADPRPSAVAAFDDDVALRVLAAMAAGGLVAPRDLAVIGFDAGRHGAIWAPALTSVRIDASAYGRRAARVALGLDGGPWPRDASSVVVRETA